ncbi:I78 family peptidase inhibitor [Croceicoccus marinus]|uniref:Peptidase inhibitor I78 n=1 Tax=Croceicoccus marinus TaxID=450378 RepID=A0A1Z1FBF8_9SPHN|nr:I78 family peptidase inhibitor [Croceicoccus marinus]ARU16084.1 hypothetical protein A9D14_07610 [Croceicoccus marinus]
MKRAAMILTLAPFALAGCTATGGGAGPEPVRMGADATCNADPVQDRLGQTATAELGVQLLTATGARTLRWAPPRSAMTMDFRPDRLTVSYDDTMAIDRISCG